MIENVTQNKSGAKTNFGASVKNPTERHVCKKGYIWNPRSCTCKNGEYVENIIDESAVICDEVIETTKTVPTKTFATKTVSTNAYILLAFLIITVASLIPVGFCCCLIKH